MAKNNVVSGESSILLLMLIPTKLSAQNSRYQPSPMVKSCQHYLTKLIVRSNRYQVTALMVPSCAIKRFNGRKRSPLSLPELEQHTGSTVTPEMLRLQTSVFTVVMNTGKRPVVTTVPQSRKRRCRDISGCLTQL